MADSLTTHAFEDAPIAHQSLDLTGVILEVNPEWEHLSGYTAAEMVGHNYLDLVPEDRVASFNVNFERLVAEGKLVGQDCQLRRKDGSVRDVLFFGRVDASAPTACSSTSLTSISSRANSWNPRSAFARCSLLRRPRSSFTTGRRS